MKNQHLYDLENESIYILREVAAQFKKPVLLFSGGKDSIVMSHLARKAFYPSRIPFPFLHVDTGHNFPETIAFRDEYLKELNADLIVRYVQDSINENKVQEETGKYASRNSLQTVTLLDAIEEFGFDACLGGARRDEENSRAKELNFSVRDDFGQWNPKNQRPELWNLFNAKHFEGEHFRVFPISNLTEMNIWNYILQEDIAIPSLYFAHERKVLFRNGSWIPESEYLQIDESEEIVTKKIRFRTLGDITITGGIESEADTLKKIVIEVAAMRETERGNRADDKRSESAMEDRKRQGYF